MATANACPTLEPQCESYRVVLRTGRALDSPSCARTKPWDSRFEGFFIGIGRSLRSSKSFKLSMRNQ
jgi:hypothetical protein